MAAHEVVLHGLGLDGEGARPTILERTDQRFLPAVLDELKAAGELATLAGTVARRRDADGVLKLFQPVHRTFHLVLVEARCTSFGRPRLDPASIESAGIVVRRMETDEQGRPLQPERLAGWRYAENQIRGWTPFAGPLQPAAVNGSDLNLDPDPARRRSPLSAGHAEIDRRLADTSLALLADPLKLSEQVAPLFVAPPQVCRAAGRTVLYGVLPVTSSERSELPAPPFEFEPEQVEQLLSILLHSQHEKTPGMANFGWLDRMLQVETWETIDGSDVLRTCLDQLLIMLDAFGESPRGRELLAVLDEVRLDYGDGVELGAGRVLRAAAEVLIQRRPAGDEFLSPAAGQVRMPRRWPAITAVQRKRIVHRAAAILQDRMRSVTPDEGRYDRAGRQYRARAFVRVKQPAPCPPQLVWSEFSEPFTIARWHDANDRAKPVQIEVPDPFAPGFLDRLKPNVAFQMPDSMFNLLDRLGMQDLLDGKKPQGGGGFGLGWICGLNITIVFMVALIIMFIFLILLNIVFFWLPYVKICIPFPKKQ